MIVWPRQRADLRWLDGPLELSWIQLPTVGLVVIIKQLLLDLSAMTVCGVIKVIGLVAAGMNVEVLDTHTAVGVCFEILRIEEVQDRLKLQKVFAPEKTKSLL